MALKRVAFALASVFALVSCGDRANDPLIGAARSVVSGVFSGEGSQTPRVDPRQVLTRDLIDQAAVPLILVENETLGTASTLTRIATNGPNETWQGDDDVTLTLSREGVLRATRGYGFDLYSADIAAVRLALVQDRAGFAPRVHTTVEGDLETVLSAYRCEVRVAGSETVNIFGRAQTLTRVVELCAAQSAGSADSFENRYWIDGAGFAWASEQYGGPDLGHFRIERLYR